MVFKKVLIYFAVPLGVTGVLIAMYFSGVDTLQQIVSPRMPGMNPNSGREFGLLENLQNVVLLAMFIVAIVGFRRKETGLEKAAMGFISFFTLFIFLEEIDYGITYYEYLNDVSWVDSAKTRNLHNIGENTDIAKRVVDIGTGVLFVIVPLAFAKSSNPLLRFLAPSRYSILTVAAMVIARTVAHELKDHGFGTGGTIQKNLSEFRELITHYVFMLYVIEIALLRTLRGPVTSEADATDESTA